jgi:hypothetical protein
METTQAMDGIHTAIVMIYKRKNMNGTPITLLDLAMKSAAASITSIAIFNDE